MPAQTLPPCGIGGQAIGGGPCTGVYTPSQAGSASFTGISSKPVISTLIAAGAILAGLIFVVWAVRAVASFFGRRSAAAVTGGEPGTMEWDDKFWADRWREANASHPDADFSDDQAGTELDTEDDTPLELEHDLEGEE